jgi:hypothetical protein
MCEMMIVQISTNFPNADITSLASSNDGIDTITIRLTEPVPQTSTIIAIGGDGSDSIHTNGALVTLILGDYGHVLKHADSWLPGGGIYIAMDNFDFISDSVPNSNDLIDVINTPANGRTVVFGGYSHDIININTLGGGDITVCGDHCQGMYAYVCYVCDFDCTNEINSILC